MKAMFEPATFVGLAAVAVWTYVRYPRLRPISLVRAIVHVALSFVGFTLLPLTLRLVLPMLQAPVLRAAAALALLFVLLTYVLLSWVWLIARIIDLLGGTPCGGHPVAREH
jgi:hypothetical protein